MTWLLVYVLFGVLCAELGLRANRRHGRTDFGVAAYLFTVATWFAMVSGILLAILIIVLVHGRRLW